MFDEIEIILKESISGVNAAYCETTGFQGDLLVNGDFPELILLDMENTGFSSFLSANRRKPVPVVMLANADGDPKLLISALDAGASDYVFKPINKTELVQTIRHFEEEVGHDFRSGNNSDDGNRITSCG